MPPLTRKSKEATFAMISIIADTLLKKKKKQDRGFCDNLYSTPTPLLKSSSLNRKPSEVLKSVIKMLKLAFHH